MININLEDQIVRRAKNETIVVNTRAITNTVLYTITGMLIANGTIGIVFIYQMLIIGSANKGTKWIIKNRKRLIKKRCNI